jgi:hypothetical protein
MDGSPWSGWERNLERWLTPFVAGLRRAAQRRWASICLKGLILLGERKSIGPMAARVAPGEVQQLHHFLSTSPWATAPLEDELVRQADRLVGGPDAGLVIDDTALVKQGKHSVGVARDADLARAEADRPAGPGSTRCPRSEVSAWRRRCSRRALGRPLPAAPLETERARRAPPDRARLHRRRAALPALPAAHRVRPATLNMAGLNVAG